MSNLEFAKFILDELFAKGVRDLVICPGARCAPLLKSAQQNPQFKIFSFFDERSASFFALGKSKSSQAPVAVITTSGSAVANCLPAVVEAKYTSTPLIILSADRPKKARGSGSPQTMDQVGIFGPHVDYNYDYDINNFKNNLINIDSTTTGPMHINVCFDEPLLGPAIAKEQFTEQDTSANTLINFASKKPILIIGPLEQNQTELVYESLASYKGPIYCEGFSQLAGRFAKNEIKNAHLHLPKDFKDQIYDGVIRVGAVPCLRFWRDLEDLKVPVINFSDIPLSGLSHIKKAPDPLSKLKDFLAKQQVELDQQELKKDQLRGEALKGLLTKFPKSELALVNSIKDVSNNFESIFIGNSLAVREWDILRFEQKNKKASIYGQRGLNGIDGLISHAIGRINKNGTHLVLLGDLSALYDLNSLWAIKHLPKESYLTIIVINNGGGKIFKPMFNDAIFENRHEMNLKSWAELFGIKYCANVKDLNFNEHTICEVFPDEQQTIELSKAIKEIK